MKAVLALLVVATCEGPASCIGEGTPEALVTESTCPSTDPPTYDNFGRTFVETYCTKCHDSAKTGEQRNGAPPMFDFDTRDGIRASLRRIDEMAAIGPAAEYRLMPPAGEPEPTDDERRRLGAYLACELAQ